MAEVKYTEKSKMIDSVMKDFKIVPYSEVSKTLNEATRKTFPDQKL
ncbi:MAG: hypothetical protein LBU81_00315 [Methanosarcinales archaeon]|jgi:hypothetical protein|nr:hypothetical protein [Methanosarcinales archaeon]